MRRSARRRHANAVPPARGSVAVTLVLDPGADPGTGARAGARHRGRGDRDDRCTRGVVFVLGIAVLVRRGMLRLRPARAATSIAVDRARGTAHGGHRRDVQPHLRRGDPNDDAIRHSGARGARHRPPRRELDVHGRRRLRRGGGGDRRAEPRRGTVRRAERAGWITAGYATVPGSCAASPRWSIAERARVALHDRSGGDRRGRAVSAHRGAVAARASCAEIVLEGAMGGAGDTLPPMLTSTALTRSRIPLAAWAAARWGATGIWWMISPDRRRARYRDDRPLAGRALETQISVTCDRSSRSSPISAPPTATSREMKGVLLVARRTRRSSTSRTMSRRRTWRARGSRSRGTGGDTRRDRAHRRRRSGRRHGARRDRRGERGPFLVGPDNGVLSPALLAPARGWSRCRFRRCVADVSRPRRVRAGGRAPRAGAPLDSLGRGARIADRPPHT